MERETGLEPATFCMASRRSSQLSYSRNFGVLIVLGLDIDKVKQLTKGWLSDVFFRPKPAYKHATSTSHIPLKELSLERRYARIPSGAQSLEAFHGFRITAFDVFADNCYLEYGLTDTSRNYFFIQPFNHKGWVFEHTDRGWQLYRAYKDAAKSSFLREHEKEDNCELMFAVDEPKLFRLSSSRFNLELVSLSYYLKRLKAEIEHG
jgi:hypothetical protein